MKKCRFITGCASLTFAMTIMLSSVASVAETTGMQKLIGAYNTTPDTAEVEWSAIERNILTASDLTASANKDVNEGNIDIHAGESETVIIVESKTSEETTNTNRTEEQTQNVSETLPDNSAAEDTTQNENTKDTI